MTWLRLGLGLGLGSGLGSGLDELLDDRRVDDDAAEAHGAHVLALADVGHQRFPEEAEEPDEECEHQRHDHDGECLADHRLRYVRVRARRVSKT